MRARVIYQILINTENKMFKNSYQNLKELKEIALQNIKFVIKLFWIRQCGTDTGMYDETDRIEGNSIIFNLNFILYNV